jgi:hypothetical protein
MLNACDAKGDFSYVYAVAPRCEVPGRSWRPVAEGPLRAPMLWHCFGTGQRGTLTEKHLLLEDVAVHRQGPIGDAAKAFIAGWLGIEVASCTPGDAGARTFRRLQDAGFDGVAQAIECEDGLLFAQCAHVDMAGLIVVTPKDLKWVHGAPALILERGSDGVARFRDVGLFIGPEAGASESMEVA